MRAATPLFVHEASVGSLASFIDAAMASNAAWKQIESKRTQAADSAQAAGQRIQPDRGRGGQLQSEPRRRQLSRANWMVGMSVSVPLLDRIDKAKMTEAARLEQQRVEVMAKPGQPRYPDPHREPVAHDGKCAPALPVHGVVD
ncbi:hypothetical protein LP419_09310 [Massilia sp. H-1]|nr:hypothetical protein LP419_09310 [Massilia sp. H-1]